MKSKAIQPEGSIARKSSVSYRRLIIRATGAVIIFSIQILLARMMGPRHFGDYAFLSTLITLFAVLSVFGLDISAENILPQYRQKHQPQFIRGFVKFSNRYITIIAISCSVGLFLFLLATSKKYSLTFSEAFFWSIIALPFVALIHHADTIRNFLSEKKPLFSVRTILYSLTLLLSFYYYYSKSRLAVDAVMMLAFLSSVIVFFIYRIRTNKKIRQLSSEAEYEIKRWISTSSGILSIEFLQALARSSGVLMLSYFANNIAAGYFFVCLRLSIFILASVSIAENVPTTEYRHLKKVQHYQKLRKTMNDGMFRILSISLPLALLLILTGKPLLRLFGEGFENQYLALVFLCISQVFLAVSTVNMKVIKAIGQKPTYSMIMIASIAATLISGAILIPLFLSAGAALAVLFASLLYYTVSLVVAKRLISK